MEITYKDKDDAKVILVYFWGNSAGNWPINQKVLTLLSEMMSKHKLCSKAMDYVPRPGFPVNLRYIRKQLTAIARRIASGDKSYDICKLTVAYQYKEIVKIASLGL